MSFDVLLEAKGLCKQFVRKARGEDQIVHALKGVSFSLGKKTSLAIIGASGSGKSTLLKVLLGAEKPSSGTFFVRGRVGFVGQDPYTSLAPVMQVEKLVAEPLIFNRMAASYEECKEPVKRVMEMVRLDYDVYRDRLPSQLSGGERQRVCIARALVFDPDIVVMDEPTSMLDQEVKQEISEIIKKIMSKQGKCFLMATHDIAMAATVCEQIFVMQDGEIIERGRSEEIFANPREELTRKFVQISKNTRAYWEAFYDI